MESRESKVADARKVRAEAVIAAIRRGEMVVVTSGDGGRGDLVMASNLVTPRAVNFMAVEGRGLISVAMTQDRLAALEIPPIGDSLNRGGRSFHVAVDLREQTTTGISAADRAMTICGLGAPDSRPDDFVRPGHVFPLSCTPGGVLSHPARVEAAVDLVQAAGFEPAAAICEVLDADGEVATLPYVQAFATEHGLALIALEDIVAFRTQTESTVTPTGEFHGRADVLVHVHPECLVGDVLGVPCRCREELQRAIDQIKDEGEGMVIYLRGDSTNCVGDDPELALQDGEVAKPSLEALGAR